MRGPKTDPNEYAYEMDIEEIEQEMESSFIVKFDEDKKRWYIRLIEEQDFPHLMICYLVGMQPEELQEYLRDNFNAEIWWESFNAFFIKKEDVDAAKEWLESMHVMASMGGSSFNVGG